ncbi:MAG: tail connector [Chaetfec virus UA24_244]|nr:MAG: tail connector [Chaetfec virus UA24_244]
MEAKVIAYLEALGVSVLTEDALLGMVINAVGWKLKNLTNLPDVPEGLEPVAIRMAAGEYLSTLKGMGRLDVETVDLEAAEKQIKEGDTQITYSVGEGTLTPEQRVDNLIAALVGVSLAEIYRYRRLVW